ncbi:hypothetical protein DAI22_07g178100 [Oryza sativa Japonica Group]|nr:hypothetical protein DAI22_07g178100 [Oryza sativa Japonica Group]
MVAAIGRRQLVMAVSLDAGSSWRRQPRCDGVGQLAARWWRATARRQFAEAVVGVGGSGDGSCDSGGGGNVGGEEGVGCEVRMTTARWLGVWQQRPRWW